MSKLFTPGKTYVLVCALLSSCNAGLLPSQRTESSGLSSVKIPQTLVKDQGQVGFCWAYAMMAFIESETLRTTGQTQDLSEEYLALYRIAGELAADVRAGTLTSAEIEKKIMGSEYEGWFVRLPDRWDAEATDAFEMVDMFGVVTESEWGVKFAKTPGLFEPSRMLNGNYKPDLVKILSTLDKDSTDADFVRAVAESFGKDMPPAGHKIKLKSKDYVALWAEKASDVPDMITLAKKTLARGIAVPMGYGVSFSKLSKSNYMWQGGGSRKVADYTKLTKKQAQKAYAYDGGHAILLTDFVNDGGREDGISASALSAEVAKSWDALSYFKFKNSWGSSTGSMPPGFYRIDTSYMLGTAQAGSLDVMVPR